MQVRFSLPRDRCNTACFYTQRAITVDGQVLTFEHKRGFANCSGQNVNRTAAEAATYPDASTAS